MQFLSLDFCPCLIFWTYFKGFLWLFLLWFFHNQYFTRFDTKSSSTKLIKFLHSFRKFSDVYSTIQIQELYREIRASVSSTCNFSRNLLYFLLSYKNLLSFSIHWMFYCFGSLVSQKAQETQKSEKNNVSFVPWAANFAEHMPTLSMRFSILD